MPSAAKADDGALDRRTQRAAKKDTHERGTDTAAVVVHYNTEALTTACLSSLAAQSHPVHAILVDNGSTDGSGVRLDGALGSRGTLVRLASPVGYATAVNRGLELAIEQGCSYALLVGSDTELKPDVVERLRAALVRDPSLAAVGPVQVYATAPERVFSAGGELDRWSWATRHIGHAESLPHVQQMGLHCPAWLDFALVLLTLRAVSDVGPLDETYGFYWEDVDWSLRATRAGYRLAVDTTAVVRHWVGGTAGTRHEWATYQKWRSRLHCARKMRGRLFQLRLLIGECATMAAAMLRGPTDTDRIRWQATRDSVCGRRRDF